MTDDLFEMPDMEDLASQMEKAMNEAQKAMDDLPDEMADMKNIMGSLTALMGGMPEQMEELTGALSGFGEQHEQNVDALAGEPDWSMDADIRVGDKLHIKVKANFDLAKIQETWESTQGPGFESLVEGMVAGAAGDLEDGMMGQIMGQLKKGRSIAKVEQIDVLACRIQGTPKDAAEQLQLSPEANIPLVLEESGIGFELAPLLTIRNQWENANIPTFSPMGDEIIVSLDHFETEDPFALQFEPAGQADEMVVELSFRPLA